MAGRCGERVGARDEGRSEREELKGRKGGLERGRRWQELLVRELFKTEGHAGSGRGEKERNLAAGPVTLAALPRKPNEGTAQGPSECASARLVSKFSRGRRPGISATGGPTVGIIASGQASVTSADTQSCARRIQFNF
jgi:hypothetical protein